MKIQDWVISDEVIIGKKLVTILEPGMTPFDQFDIGCVFAKNPIKRQYLTLLIKNVGEKEFMFNGDDLEVQIIYDSISI
jgi:hypothetical protein